MNEEKLIELIDKHNWDLAGNMPCDFPTCHMRSIQKPKLVVAYSIKINMANPVYLKVFYDNRQIGYLDQKNFYYLTMDVFDQEPEPKTPHQLRCDTLNESLLETYNRFEAIRLYNEEEKVLVIDALLNPPEPQYKGCTPWIFDEKEIPNQLKGF